MRKTVLGIGRPRHPQDFRVFGVLVTALGCVGRGDLRRQFPGQLPGQRVIEHPEAMPASRRGLHGDRRGQPEVRRLASVGVRVYHVAQRLRRGLAAAAGRVRNRGRERGDREVHVLVVARSRILAGRLDLVRREPALGVELARLVAGHDGDHAPQVPVHEVEERLVGDQRGCAPLLPVQSHKSGHLSLASCGFVGCVRESARRAPAGPVAVAIGRSVPWVAIRERWT